MKLIHRYVVKEVLQSLSFILFALYFLFILLDYSTHMKNFHQEGLPFYEILLYYLFQFTQKVEIFLPISLLMATLKVLISMQRRNELVALLSAGIPFKKFYRPFLAVGALATLFLLLNFQYLQPAAHTFLDHFEKSFLRRKGSSNLVHTLHLPNETLLIYQSYFPKEKTFHNVFIIKSLEEIYHMRTLELLKDSSTGKKVDFFIRNGSFELVKSESRPTYSFPKIDLKMDKLNDSMILPTHLAPTRLMQKTSSSFFHFKAKKLTDKGAEIATTLSYKLLSPLLALLGVIAPASYCLVGGRNFSFILLYALFIFGMLSFFALIKSALVLGESQLLPPFWSLFTPFLLVFAFFGRRYAKL